MARVFGFRTSSSAVGTSIRAASVNQMTLRIVCRPMSSVTASSTCSKGRRRFLLRPISQTAANASR